MYLNCHSHFSFRYGTLSVLDLLDMAEMYQQESIALTDINNTSACLNFVRLAKGRGIKPVLGVDFRNGVKQQFVLLAKNNLGFEQINKYLSSFLHQKLVIPSRAENITNTFAIYPFASYKNELIALRDDEFIGVSLGELNQLSFSSWRNHLEQIVLLQPVSFQHKRSYNIHRLLRAIDSNCLLSKLPAEEVGNYSERMYPAEKIEDALKYFPQIVKNTNRIMAACSIDFTFKKGGKAINNNKSFFTSGKVEDQRLLKNLCEEGLHYRFPKLEERENVRARVQKELKLICSQGFETYFLICWDMLCFARLKGFFYVGRGSGANSLVAYLLRITDVNPVKLDLYFERFLNPYRESPSDFDMVFSWRDRNQVIDYLFEKYGKNHQIALLATYNTFTKRSLLRALGKVFGVPKAEIDQLFFGKMPEKQAATHDFIHFIYTYAAYMGGLPSHLSIHAGGVIIAERSVYHYSATSMPPKAYPLLQFDMVHAENIGLYKLDVLSQRGLGKIKDTLNLIKKRGKTKVIDLHNIESFLSDKSIKQLIKKGETMGCFYIESPAMRMLLRKLEVDNYLALVAASSIIRPGVAQSGMMQTYILRAKGKDEGWQKRTPKILREIMPDTYGVMVYQEDVIKVAHHFGRLTLGEADLLRRGMSGKFRSRESFELVHQKFFNNAIEKGYEKELVAEVWRQIESFAAYAFTKGHSASYAVESFQCLYLKAHFPIEFMVAVVNNGGGFYHREIYLNEAKRLGAELMLPCINKSEWLTSLHGENKIYLGFSFLKDIEEKTMLVILEDRKLNDCFKNLEDFINRCLISKQQLLILLQAEAFRFTGLSKEVLLWQYQLYFSTARKSKTQGTLFSISSRKVKLPTLDKMADEVFYRQLELFGFSLISPFEMLKNSKLLTLVAKDLCDYIGKLVRIVGYLVTAKNSKTKYGERMQFGTFIDAKGGWIDTVHFPKTVQRYPFKAKACYLIEGKVKEEFGYLTVEVYRQETLAYRLSAPIN